MDLKNSTILITGGTSGMGLEFVKQFTKLGTKVIATGRKLESLNETKKQFPNVHIFQSDVSKPQDIEQLYKEVTTQFPNLNIIINNAGLMRQIDLQDTTIGLENINQEVATNLTGTIQMVHQFLPHLKKQKTAGIVNVSSGIAFMPFSISPIYSATKAAIRAYTQVLRLQLQDTNVKVFEMIPPKVNTNLEKNWSHQSSTGGMEADKMVQIAIKGLSNNKKELKPFLIRIIKTVSRIAPGLLLKVGHREFKTSKQAKN